ncbi:hypothetical protein GCM10007425_31190 [Lysinibacillus alkalisoli]|uniref:Uncharacterized protein n=1 Tax=Lysinibacillus alkalisoli TaxID=1911548 RepID=A0A917GAK0_9BACI|nr:hypothetical protein [Lysinibacillus alkalisoli]GGG34228.1 hypothetical protein GCM10007425_31190 [Lysinibacillus alkalisoli]
MVEDIYSGNSEKDFAIFFGMILEEKEINQQLKSKYKAIHKRIYNFKEIINISGTQEATAQSFLLETLNGLIDVTDLLSKNRYKLASTILRNSMETFAKYLVVQNQLQDYEGFTNNFESATSHLINNYISLVLRRPRNKDFKRLINTSYKDPFRNLYGELCDIVHARDTNYSEYHHYLESIRNSNFNQIKFEKVFNFIISCVDKMVVIFYLQNAEFLLENANQVKLDYLLSNFDENFSEVRTYFP